MLMSTGTQGFKVRSFAFLGWECIEEFLACIVERSFPKQAVPMELAMWSSSGDGNSGPLPVWYLNNCFHHKWRQVSILQFFLKKVENLYSEKSTSFTLHWVSIKLNICGLLRCLEEAVPQMLNSSVHLWVRFPVGKSFTYPRLGHCFRAVHSLRGDHVVSWAR